MISPVLENYTFNQWRLATNSVISLIGDEQTLLTTNKSSIVSAINEVFGIASAVSGANYTITADTQFPLSITRYNNEVASPNSLWGATFLQRTAKGTIGVPSYPLANMSIGGMEVQGWLTSQWATSAKLIAVTGSTWNGTSQPTGWQVWTTNLNSVVPAISTEFFPSGRVRIGGGVDDAVGMLQVNGALVATSIPSANLTGTPTATTAVTSDSSTRVATTEFVKLAITLGNSAGGTFGSDVIINPTAANSVLRLNKPTGAYSSVILFQDVGVSKFALGYANIGSAGATNFTLQNLSGTPANVFTVFGASSNVAIGGTADNGYKLELIGTSRFFGNSILDGNLTLNGTLSSSNLVTGQAYQINGTSVLSSNTLGAGITTSSLQVVGTISTGVWNATIIGLNKGGTGANLSVTGGAGQYLKQSINGAAVTVGTIPLADIVGAGTIASQNAATVAITGGSLSGVNLSGVINSATIGLTTPAAAAFTSLTANSFVPNSATLPTNGLFLPAANTIGFATNSLERFRVGSTGNVLVGSTVDDGVGLLQVNGAITTLTATAGDSSTKAATTAFVTTGLASFVGTTNITTLGTIGTGVWNGTVIADNKIATNLTGKTYNALSLSAATTGFIISGGTTNQKSLTVINSLVLAGNDNVTLNVGTGGTLTNAAFISAASTNTASTIVQRDLNGDFAANIITGKAFSGTLQTLTTAATLNWNLALGDAATVTLNSATHTLAIPTNMKVGSYMLIVKQDATGSRNISTWTSAYKFPSGIKPVLSSAANAIDIISFYCDGTNMYGSYIRGLA